jgi:hypothetical protein
LSEVGAHRSDTELGISIANCANISAVAFFIGILDFGIQAG